MYRSIKNQEERLSLQNVATNLRLKNQLYTDKISKIYNNLGILSKPEVSTGLSVISCINCIIAIAALGTSIRVNCKLLILIKGTRALSLMQPSTVKPECG